MRQLITPPPTEAISLEEAKLHLRVDGNDEDSLIAELVASAREDAEKYLRRQLLPATWRLGLDCFPSCGEIVLRPSPLRSVESITYYDADGVLQTLDPARYHVDSMGEPGRVVPVAGSSWPATQRRPNAVLVEYVSGYEDAAAVPARIKSAMLLDIGDAYAFRETNVVGTVSSELKRTVRDLLGPFRVRA